MVITTMRLRMTKSLMNLEKKKRKKLQQESLMTFNVKENFCDTIKGDMDVETEANVYEPFAFAVSLKQL